MTTFVPFVPSNISAPAFQATFDGDPYTVVVTWNVAAQRYYVNVFSINGDWVCTVPLVTTAHSRSIVSLTYDPPRSRMIMQLSQWVWRPMGQIVELTIENCAPDVLNGLKKCLRLSPTSSIWSFGVFSDPGQVTAIGSVCRYHNLIAGYFSSVMIFRNGQFEINP